MKQVYHRYELWEDYQNGMYETQWTNEGELVLKSKKLLSNPKEFCNIASEMIDNWKIAAENNLTNKSMNRRAWIGQAACCYNHGCPELLTRVAWKELTDEQRTDANIIADGLIRRYERKDTELYFDLGR